VVEAVHQGNHGNHGGRISPTTPPSIEEALKIIHDNERPHASLGLGAPDNGFFLHGGEAPDRQGPPGLGQDPCSPAKAEREPSSLSTDEVDTGIHVRTEDIQSLDEDSSSLRDYSDIDPDYEATTRSCPLPNRQDRSVGGGGGDGGGGGARGGPADDAHPVGERGEGAERSSPLRPRAGSTLPRSHTVSPVSSSTGGSGVVRMTSFAEQKFRKLEGRSSGGTTPESSELNLSYPRPARALSLEVRSHHRPEPPSRLCPGTLSLFMITQGLPRCSFSIWGKTQHFHEQLYSYGYFMFALPAYSMCIYMRSFQYF
jgi:hypothetical protein